jgi:predicted phage terminase large subunit-like protein
VKRAVREQAQAFAAEVVLIEDKASGTQLIQELVADGLHAVTRYQPQSDKVMRMHAQTAMIENGFVHLPKEAAWLAEYLHELTAFPKGKQDDQVDSTAQMLDWFKRAGQEPQDWMWLQYKRAQARGQEPRAARTIISDGEEARHPPAVILSPRSRTDCRDASTGGRAVRRRQCSDRAPTTAHDPKSHQAGSFSGARGARRSTSGERKWLTSSKEH